jgi:hypothetical protein
LLREPLDEDWDGLDDPEVLIAESYDQTLLEMKESLVNALTHRKQQVLPVAVQMFNKLQDKSYKTKRFNEFKKMETKD